MRIEISTQVADFLRTLAPEPRKRIRKALRDLAADQGDILELEHPLDGFYRLRIGRCRVIFHYTGSETDHVIRCDYAERRELIYEVFNDLIRGE